MEDEEEFFFSWLIPFSKKLQEFYKIKDDELVNAAKHIKTLQDNCWQCYIYENVDYNDITNCCAYLAVYASSHAVITVDGIRWFHEQKTKLFNAIFERKIVNIVCAGGGPGNDFLGFCYAMESYCTHYRELRKLNMTVIDSASWENIMAKVMVSAISNDAGKVQSFLRRVKFSSNFVKADLKCYSGGALKDADLIIMTKVLSVVSDEDKLDMMKNIIASMKTGAVLVCIDVPCREVEQFVNGKQLNDVTILKITKDAKIFEASTRYPVTDHYDANGKSKYKICVLQKIIP